MEELVRQNFQLYKGMGVGISLVLILFFQLLFPNRRQVSDYLMIWKVNVPLALIDAFLLYLICGACVCNWAAIIRSSGLGAFDQIGLPYWSQIAVTVFVLDFVAYFWHRANHACRFLWRFHSVHHSDTCFEVTTAFRFHPGELIISLAIRLVVVTLTGLPLLGLVVFEILFAFFNLLVHSDVRMAPVLERPLNKIVITPSLHRLHHSDRTEELNTNFGTIFSFWDRLGSSFVFANTFRQVSVGLPGQQGKFLSLPKALTLPAKG